MLLSDRDLRAELAAVQFRLDPYDDDSLMQPASVDVRQDRWFRVFRNARYTHIDPAREQDDVTEPVEPAGRSRSCCIRASSSSGRRWR